MPSAFFIDTNLLLYAQDRNAPEKAARIASLLGILADRDAIVVNAQVIKEYAHNIIRKFPRPDPSLLLAELEAMRAWCRAPLDIQTALDGLRIHLRYGFSYYDACLVASALEFGCDVFLTEDLAHGQQIAELQIINPFLAEFGSFLGQT